MERCIVCSNVLDCGEILEKIKRSDSSVLAYIEADRQCFNFEMNETSLNNETVQKRFKMVLSELLEKSNEL